MVTVCWLLGSVIGIRIARLLNLPTNGFVLLAAAPFNTQLWPVYAALLAFTGLYPGVFFVRLGEHYTARMMFFKEHNGFILGLVSGTLLFLVLGRAALWTIPIYTAGIVIACTTILKGYLRGVKTSSKFERF